MSHLKNATLIVIPSVWGHVGELLFGSNMQVMGVLKMSILAGGGGNPKDVEFTTARIQEFLQI